MTQSTRIAQKAQEITDLIESVRGLADLGITLDELIAEGYLSDTEIQIAHSWVIRSTSTRDVIRLSDRGHVGDAVLLIGLRMQELHDSQTEVAS